MYKSLLKKYPPSIAAISMQTLQVPQVDSQAYPCPQLNCFINTQEAHIRFDGYHTQVALRNQYTTNGVKIKPFSIKYKL